jgi:hypothetical protein
MGYLKVFSTTLSLRKQLIIDEEKYTRMQQLRYTGIPPVGNAEIPFGIRAIESGIEVDGIWISRPRSPKQYAPSPDHRPADATTLPEADDAPEDQNRDSSSPVSPFHTTSDTFSSDNGSSTAQTPQVYRLSPATPYPELVYDHQIRHPGSCLIETYVPSIGNLADSSSDPGRQANCSSVSSDPGAETAIPPPSTTQSCTTRAASLPCGDSFADRMRRNAAAN